MTVCRNIRISSKDNYHFMNNCLDIRMEADTSAATRGLLGNCFEFINVRRCNKLPVLRIKNLIINTNAIDHLKLPDDLETIPPCTATIHYLMLVVLSPTETMISSKRTIAPFK